MAKRASRSTRSTGPARASRKQTQPLRIAGPIESGGTPPAAESYVATCRALLVLAAPAERDDARAQTIAESAVREAIGEGYRVDALGPGARDYRVSRVDGALISPGVAWTQTRALQAHRDIADA